MESTRNCTEEVILKIIGKMSLEFEELVLLDTQISIKHLLEECLQGYIISTPCTDLLVSDIQEHIDSYLLLRSLEGISQGTLYNYRLILSKFQESNSFTPPPPSSYL